MKIFKSILFFSIIIIIGVASYAAIRVQAQNKYSNNIFDHLKKRGVPVKYVVTRKQIPYEVEIALQSSSEDDKLSVEDNWFMQLARREATLAYRSGTGLHSFTLIVFNNKKDIIYSTQTYLYSEDLSQQYTLSDGTLLDDAVATKIVRKQLQLSGLSLDSLDIFSENIDNFNGQVLLLQISSQNIETANKSLPIFLPSFFKMLDTINENSEVHIVLVHIKLLDKKGTVLLDYVKDVESGSTQWSSASGLYSEWYPHPPNDKNTSPIPTPMPIFSSPIKPIPK